MNLVHHSGLVLTDSGGVQKESFFANKCCICLFESTAWPETIHAGACLVRSYLDDLGELCNQLFNKMPRDHPSKYFGTGSSAEIIVDHILEDF